jgi:hypothetical protein
LSRRGVGLGVSDRSLPPILAFGDTLDRIEAATDDPMAGRYVDEIREGLDDLAARPPEARESLVTDLENLLDSLRTCVDGDAALWAETVRSRFVTYRHARRTTSATLHVANGRLERDGEPITVTAGAGEATLRGRIVNTGERTDAMAALAFYRDGRAVWKVESREFAVGPGEARALDLTVYVPADTDYYGLAAFEPADPAAVATGAPEPGA